MIRKGLTWDLTCDKMLTCEQRFKGGERGSHSYSWRKNLPSKENSQCKGPVAGVYNMAELRRTGGDEFLKGSDREVKETQVM